MTVSPTTPPAHAPDSHAGTTSFLLSALGTAASRRFAHLLEPLGIAPRAYAALSAAASAESDITQQQLGDRLGVHRNTVVALIDELEAGGWARRRRHATDRRAFQVDVTASGRRLLRTVGRGVAALDEDLCRDLGPTDRRRLRSLLERVAFSAGLDDLVHPLVPDR